MSLPPPSPSLSLSVGALGACGIIGRVQTAIYPDFVVYLTTCNNYYKHNGFVNWFWYCCYGVRKCLEAMIPTEVSSVEAQLYPVLCVIKQINNFYKTQ